MIAEEMGFNESVPVSGQTYSRKMDYQVCSVLAGIAQSASKFSNDIRILQSFKEIEEPFEKNQIGSSAMAYKRNPMRDERITSLARYVMCDVLNPAFTAGTQWFERTLDDSANKRISVAEAFLGTDAILNILLNVTDLENGLVVYDKIITRRVMAETSVYGYGEYNDGRCKERRKPPGIARAYQRVFYAGRKAGQAGGT